MWRTQPNAGRAAARAPHSAHLAHVSEIVGKSYGKHKTERMGTVVTAAPATAAREQPATTMRFLPLISPIRIFSPASA
jgi:hypothetical protein